MLRRRTSGVFEATVIINPDQFVSSHQTSSPSLLLGNDPDKERGYLNQLKLFVNLRDKNYHL
jgi:hypothetical protein